MASYMSACEGATGTDKTIIGLTSAAAVVGAMHQLIIGSDAAPNDVAIDWRVIRYTAAGTKGTTPIAKPTNPLKAASGMTAMGGAVYSVEPTYETNSTDSLLMVQLNQRATYTWIANPGRELVTASGATNGIGVKSSAVSSGTPNCGVTIAWDE